MEINNLHSYFNSH